MIVAAITMLMIGLAASFGSKQDEDARKAFGLMLIIASVIALARILMEIIRGLV